MNIIIVGCGRVGVGLAQALHHHHTITMIDKDPHAFERLGKNFKGQTIEGVGFDRDILLKAGIEHTDGLAAVTNSDEANVITAQVARQIFHVPKVVARLYDPRQAEIYRRLGLHTIAPNSWGIQRITDILLHSELDIVFSLSDQLDLVEVEISPLLVGHQVKDLTIPGELQVVAIQRGNQVFIPTLGTIFQKEDRAFVAVMTNATDRLNQMLQLH